MKVLCISHTPLRGRLDPVDSAVAEIDTQIETLRERVRAFAPELVVLFAPDHFNGFFYDLMPSFCIGTAASAIGDFGTVAGELSVPTALASACAASLLEQGIDVAVSHRMRVDHGFANPLQDIFGGLAEVPVIPVFINSVAPPLPTISRSRALGRAVGVFARSTGKRTMFVGSGGLSHEPPVPRYATAPSDVKERLISGRNPPPAISEARLERLMHAATSLARGDPRFKPLNPQWDRQFLDLLKEGRIAECDSWSDDEMGRVAGDSAHEVRTWLAAVSAVEADGHPAVDFTYYREVPEWIAGFGLLWGSAA